MGSRRDPAGLTVVAVRTVARGVRWLILLLALYTIALSLPRLKVWPDGWEIPASGFIQSRIGVGDETAAGIALASLALSYWGAREGKEATADLIRIISFLSGLPWLATLMDWFAKGVAVMFKTIRQRAMNIIREEARAEGLAEGLSEGRTKGRAEGRSEGRTEGRAEGRAEGRTEEAARWQAWLERRIVSNPELLNDDDPPPAPPRK